MKRQRDVVMAEIDKLNEMKPRVRHYSQFNDDNWQAIDAQLEVLREDLSMEEIDERWGDYEDAFGGALYDAAVFAYGWKGGFLLPDDDAPPSDDWQILLTRQ